MNQKRFAKERESKPKIYTLTPGMMNKDLLETEKLRKE
jgi:hypothetical protein